MLPRLDRQPWNSPTNRMGRFTNDAAWYFYPGGSWDGYDKWFCPSISGRVGSPLIGLIHQGLKERDSVKLMKAAMILCMSHDKDVYKKGHSGPVGQVTCRPTGESLVAIEYLNDAIEEINGQYLQECQNQLFKHPDKTVRTYPAELPQIFRDGRRR